MKPAAQPELRSRSANSPAANWIFDDLKDDWNQQLIHASKFCNKQVTIWRYLLGLVTLEALFGWLTPLEPGSDNGAVGGAIVSAFLSSSLLSIEVSPSKVGSPPSTFSRNF